MHFTNKMLAILILSTILISLGTSLFMVHKIHRLDQEPRPTYLSGHAIEDYGNVSVDVTNQIAIQINASNMIAFQNCSPLPDRVAIINSENSSDTGTVCPTFTPSNLTIVNLGNIEANVSINVSNVGTAHGTGGTFLNGGIGGSAIAYRTSNHSGCLNGLIGTYTNFTNTSLIYPACNRLTVGENRAFDFNVQIQVPQSMNSGTNQVNLTFWAEQAS